MHTTPAGESLTSIVEPVPVPVETSLVERSRKMWSKFKASLRKPDKEPETTETIGPDTSVPDADRDGFSWGTESSERFAEFPDSVSNIDISMELGGSSNVRAGEYMGEMFVVKKARTRYGDVENREQLVDEYIADSIYRAFGFDVPESKIYDRGAFKVSRFIPGKNLNTLSAGDVMYEQVRQELRKGFVLDCLMANWDVVGAVSDNIRIGDDGKVYRIDNGGSLRFRARGGEKGRDFGGRVGELDTLRERVAIFQDITDEEIKDQITYLLDDREKIFDVITQATSDLGLDDDAVDSLIDVLDERLSFLEDFLLSGKDGVEAEYRSQTTKKYFESWGSLRIDGNPELKGTIRENIIAAEEEHSRDYAEYASRMRISVEEFKSRLQARVEQLVNNSNFFRATHADVLENVLFVDGRYKSQFETQKSDGTFYPSYRAEAEKSMFGFNNSEDEGKSRRPIYGYFSDDEFGVLNSRGKNPPPNSVEQYGRVTVKIRREKALDSATITFQDSLGKTTTYPPTPARAPHFTSLELGYGVSLDSLSQVSMKNWGGRYTEVQYHDQLKATDIDTVYVSEGNGSGRDEVERVKDMIDRYNNEHPDQIIKFVEY